MSENHNVQPFVVGIVSTLCLYKIGKIARRLLPYVFKPKLIDLQSIHKEVIIISGATDGIGL